MIDQLPILNRFPNLTTPDLGCFVRRIHDFQIENFSENIYTEVVPTPSFTARHHQVYFRISCGRSPFYQRCFVYMTRSVNEIPPFLLEFFPPDWVLGGDFPPNPSDWQKYPTQTGQRFYWFVGQHRNPSNSNWQANTAFGHTFDEYENGILSSVRYKSAEGDDDFSDLVLEVAVIKRNAWLDILEAKNQAKANARFIERALPDIVKKSDVAY